MLSVRGLARLHLGPVDLDIAAGECVALRGRSGAGKSVLMRSIADLDPAEGEISLDGVSRDRIPATEWRRKVGYLPAEPGWWAERVADHFLGLQACGGLLRRLDLATDCGEWAISRLSTGERQRLGLVRLLEGRPRCLLLDEPTSSLDRIGTTAVETLIAEHCAAGGCCLIVTHDEEQFARVAARRFRLEEGRLVPEAGA